MLEEHEDREVCLTAFDEADERRESPYETRGRDAAIGFAVTHPELATTEIEERRKRAPELQTTILDLDEVDEQPREKALPLEVNGLRVQNEIVVREVVQVHGIFLHPQISGR
jgi:hypothetical protein